MIHSLNTKLIGSNLPVSVTFRLGHKLQPYAFKALVKNTNIWNNLSEGTKGAIQRDCMEHIQALIKAAQGAAKASETSGFSTAEDWYG